jgi:hypothetical protein
MWTFFPACVIQSQLPLRFPDFLMSDIYIVSLLLEKLAFNNENKWTSAITTRYNATITYGSILRY